MKKQLTGRIKELVPSKEYRVIVNLGRDASGKYPCLKRKFYGNKREAESYLRKWIYELEHPEEEMPTDTVGEWLDKWINNDVKILLKWEDNTHDRAKRIIDSNIKPYIKDVILAELNPDDVLALYSDLRTGSNGVSKKLSPRSLRYVHQVLNQSLKHAAKMGKIKKNPAEGLTPAAAKEKDKEKWVVVDAKQLKEFLEQIVDHRDYPIVYVAAYTGARQSELLGLTWNKIWWDKKIIRIEQTLHTKKKGEFERRPRTKNDTSIRSVKVTERVLGVLREHKKAQEAKGRSVEPGDLVFTDKTGEPIKRDNLGHRYSNLASNHGHEGMTFHHLRHTHATILLTAGANINEVAERLGHADPSITLSIYGHVLPGRDQSLAEKFDSLLDPDTDPENSK